MRQATLSMIDLHVVELVDSVVAAVDADRTLEIDRLREALKPFRADELFNPRVQTECRRNYRVQRLRLRGLAMSALSTVFRSLRRAWWFALWGLRPSGRMFLARTGWGGQAVMLRNAWHWLFGNVFSVLLKAALWLGFSFSPFPWDIGLDVALIVTVAYGLLFMLLYQLATNGGAPSRVIMRFRLARAVFGWRLGWRFRSRWPMEWAIPANKTKTVQAEVGTTAEATVTIRPVFDAPKMSWWPRIEWPMISWWVSPPPGRTFEQFESVLDVLASNIANVVSINLDYERSSSSIGRLSVLFDDPLAEPVLPDFHVNEPDDGDTDLAEVVDLAEILDLRPLRLVVDDESEVSV